jgi:hypothetical protein
MDLTKKERLLRASTDIGTGMIECGYCGLRYYYQNRKLKSKNGNYRFYASYTHHSRFNETICKQKPKSFNIGYVNEILKLYFFYFNLVFDDTNDRIKESQRSIKQTQTKLTETIDKIGKEIAKIERQMAKYQKALETTDDVEIIKILAKNISNDEEKINTLNIEMSKAKIEYELQNEKFNMTLLEMTYYDVKEKIVNWFTKLNIEDQRTELIKCISKCVIMNEFIIIDTGKMIFLFDILHKYKFDMKLLDNLNKDEVYKAHFIQLKNKKEARRFDDKLIHNINLNRSKDIRMRVFQYLVKTYNIFYDISDKTNLISFVPLRGLLMLELEDLSS